MFVRGQQVNGVRLRVDIVFFLSGLGALTFAIDPGSREQDLIHRSSESSAVSVPHFYD